MKAILLAAGRGSRLKSLTDNRPKSLVAFNGESLLPRAIRSLRGGGATEIGIVAGYLAETLQPYADQLFMNRDWSSTGIFHSLSQAAPWLERHTCLVSYSDIFYSPELVAAMVAAEGDIVVAYDPDAVKLWQQRFDDPLGDLERFVLDQHGHIREIGGRAQSLGDIQGQYMGLLKLSPRGWQIIKDLREALAPEARDNIDMTSLLARAIAAGHHLKAVPSAQPWGEIDCPSDIELYERIYPGL